MCLNEFLVINGLTYSQLIQGKSVDAGMNELLKLTIFFKEHSTEIPPQSWLLISPKSVMLAGMESS